MPIAASPDEPTPPSRGLAQMFGLHPAVAAFTFVVDAMLYGEEGLAALLTPFTAGGSLLIAVVISCCAGGVLGLITYKGQQKWHGDDRDTALIKALIIGFLTALPFPLPLPAMLSVPAGLLGLLGGRKDD
jgi:prepilin signal peptidase PulO-like enzyme (type II secretory pathway)